MPTSGSPLGRQGRRSGIAVLAAVCALAAVPAAAQAAEQSLYAAPAPAGTGDCGSAADACAITTAVTNANALPITDSVRIKLAGGTYALAAPSPTALVITFAGPSLTLEAAEGSPTLDGANAVRLLSVAATSNVTIDGLAIRFGRATGGLGGAIQNDGTLTVKRSTLTNNAATNGGAIANGPGGTLTVQDSSLSDNAATSVGGGAIINTGVATVVRSALIDNTAPVNGGAINVQPSGTLTVSASTIVGNTSGGLGGAFSNLGTLKVQASTITGNTASGGAALATGNSNVTLAASIIASGSAVDACNPANSAIADAGYNLDDDGTCVSPTSPATGSHNGTTVYGDSTYGAALDAYLADAPANNGGPSRTLALLNTPDPLTTLANPAFDIVPASFTLPVPVDGVSTACSLADQRGVVPVAGRNCAIGAYLLQTTTTELATPAALAGQDVTLTATITPAAIGGTMSFNDGAGNPATTHCGAQPVAGGTATCTVVYPAIGSYPVTATYTGDGAGNNYVGSTSATQTVTVTAPAAPTPTPTPDRTAPTTTVRRIATIKQPVTLRGTAADDGTVSRVRVSVARHVSRKQCRFLQPNLKFSRARNCDETSYIDAKGTAVWSLKLPVLPHGRYTIWIRGVDVVGNVERKARGRNLLVIRIPAKRT